ncbi:MAG TPA: hypothetical protein VHP11_08885 [Tepidisphaeraceae bacterium]|nr:hypothetical protein [Tepidisphaeraceae bacterium]
MFAKSLLYSFLALTAHMFLPRYSARLQILLLQIRMLKSRLKSARIVATPEENRTAPRGWPGKGSEPRC